MAAPTPTARQTPAGIKLKDGYSTKITLAVDPDISFWEKTVQPPGLDQGDKIDQTTMHNDTYKTAAPQSLTEVMDSTTTAAYDPDAYDEIQAVIGVETTITVTFPDGSTLAYFGFLKSFEPSECQPGEQPEADITICATNWDPVNKVEAAPVMTEVSGT